MAVFYFSTFLGLHQPSMFLCNVFFSIQKSKATLATFGGHKGGTAPLDIISEDILYFLKN